MIGAGRYAIGECADDVDVSLDERERRGEEGGAGRRLEGLGGGRTAVATNPIAVHAFFFRFSSASFAAATDRAAAFESVLESVLEPVPEPFVSESSIAAVSSSSFKRGLSNPSPRHARDIAPGNNAAGAR